MKNNLRRQLRAICNSGIEKFAHFGTVEHTKHGLLVHADNGSNILGVAHLDTVLSTPYIDNGNTVMCPQLDDRLGVWTLLSLLPSLDCPKFDILLTDNEERANSTAQYFVPDKRYNWIFEFDRQGTDVVMYEYEDIDMELLLQGYGFNLGIGSYSDICELDFMCVKAFNFGVGYHKQHTTACYANLNDTIAMARKFCKFAHENYDTKFEHYPHYNIGEEFCYGCNKMLEFDWDYCPYCGTQIFSNKY